MSKTIRMEEEDSNKITIPPLSIDEEGEEVIMDLNEAAGSVEKALFALSNSCFFSISFSLSYSIETTIFLLYLETLVSISLY